MATDARDEITREGYDSLMVELQELRTVRRSEIIEAIKVAREFGDLKENAEYHAAKDEQGMVEARITALEGRMARMQVVEAPAKGAVAGIGSRITFTAGGKTSTYELVNSLESQLAVGKLSSTSPIGQALLNSREGDVVKARLPNGKRRELTVTKIA